LRTNPPLGELGGKKVRQGAKHERLQGGWGQKTKRIF